MSAFGSIRAFFGHLGQNVQAVFRGTWHNNASDHVPEAGPPRNSLQRRQSVAAESFDPEEDIEETGEEHRLVYPKTDIQRARLSAAVKEILLFRCLDEEQTSLVIDAMQEKTVKSGELIIKQGDDGDNFYVIESGTYDVYVRAPSDDHEELGKKVCSYNDHGSFGELALMYNTSRAATIKAVTDGVLWFMDRNTFRKIVLKAAFLKRQMYEELLKEVSVLKELSPYERLNIADALHSRTYNDKECIISQGEPGKEMYIIESGAARIVVKEKNKEVEVNQLGKGDYFGVLDVASFERLMGPCLVVMERNMDTYQEQLKTLLGTDHLVAAKLTH
ncbi:cAMP-dependent protein kinase type II-alpha regulatory subunit [Paragonimus heterotremus]|uniref:cAMP-dependent protein kinase type II-alpha regulatory subunit n=1 Tax=Paragonimus heterotremus TaxID=100268 RepID=A0A8J4TM41_9TREM|nr:cAMP-dependent protein kinase type II-alpha regulatory subunit [Paragonimus heterotremus]